MQRLPRIFVLLACLLTSASGRAQGVGGLQDAINGAIDRGVDFLLARQNRDGSWGDDLLEDPPHFDRRTAATALVIYTLRKHKLTPEHPALQRGLLFLEQSLPTHTYSTATELLAFEAVDAVKYKKRIEELAAQLIDFRNDASKTWGYPVHASVPNDLSNTQYAALGLRAAHHAGVETPKKVWLELIDGVLAHQEDVAGADKAPKSGEESNLAAGFRYRPTREEGVTASMTAAGVSVLGIAKECLGKALDPPTGRKVERAQKLGLNWLTREFTVEGNPGGAAAWHHYYLYGIERVAALCSLDRIGEHDWYREGAGKLVREQRDDGSWSSGAPASWPAQPLTNANTCFALLFLMKATAPTSGSGGDGSPDTYAAEGPDNDVWIRASGRSKLTLWISGFGPDVESHYATGIAPEHGLRIRRVEFWIDGALAHEVQVDSSKAWKRERFAQQHPFSSDGRHVVQARVVADLPAELATPEQTTVELRSAELEVFARDVFQPWMLDYCTADAHNKLRTVRLRVQASSELDKISAADHAVDGLQALAWRFKPDDAAPTLTIELDKPVRISALTFSHANANPLEIDLYARVTKLALRINKASDEVVVDATGDPQQKFEYVLEKPLVLRQLEVRIVAIEGGSQFPKVSGLAEIEAR